MLYQPLVSTTYFSTGTPYCLSLTVYTAFFSSSKLENKIALLSDVFVVKTTQRPFYFCGSLKKIKRNKRLNKKLKKSSTFIFINTKKVLNTDLTKKIYFKLRYFQYCVQVFRLEIQFVEAIFVKKFISDIALKNQQSARRTSQLCDFMFIRTWQVKVF